MQKNSKKLTFAWILFISIFIIFIVWTKLYYDSQNEKSLKYQCRIMIDASEIIKSKGIDFIQKDIPDMPLIKEVIDDSIDFHKFYEYSKYGNIPKISPDGMRVLDVYSAKVDTAKNGKKVFLVIQIDNSPLAMINALLEYLGDSKVTFIVPHYHNELHNIVEAIRRNGHEFFLQIPTQSSIPENKKSNISPFLANAGKDDLIGKLLCLLASTKYAIGIANISTTLLTKSWRDMTIICEELSKRGLAFLDLAKSGEVVQKMAESADVIYPNVDVIFSSTKKMELKEIFDNIVVFININSLKNFLSMFSSKKTEYIISPISQFLKK